MTAFESLSRFLLLAGSLSACTRPATPKAAPSMSAWHSTHTSDVAVSWGIPRFFEVGQQVRLEGEGPSVDTSGWPAAILRVPNGAPRAYVSAAIDDRSSVFVYPEPDPSQRLRRYALVVPEPKTFSTNDLVTAFWGRSPLLMNFALGAARSFANFTRTTASGPKRVLPVRARLEPGGVNPQESENVFELEDSRLAILEHKGLVPGEPLSFLEFTIYDRDSATEDSEPAPVATTSAPDALSVALIPLREEHWLRRRSFESSGYRVVLVSDATGQSYFLATPSEFRPGWGFGEASTDLTLGQLDAIEGGDAGAGSAAALSLEHATQGWLLCGMVRDSNEVASLLERGTHFRARLQQARQELRAGEMKDFAARAARDFLDAHRSHRAPRTLTRFAHGDARQPANSVALSAGIRYGQDLASALRGLISTQRATKDAALLPPIADLAESSLAALIPSGATFSQRFDQLAIVAERDESSGRADIFLDNGSLAVAINHRRLLLASSQSHVLGATWGAFGATIDGQRTSVDQALYEFGVDGASLPQSVKADAPELAVSRLFTPESGSVRIRETAQLLRGVPAVRVHYQLENRSEQPAMLTEARITLADFLEYGTGPNESSQSRYGLGHVADGVRLPIGFWMEGMRAPLWGDAMAPGELDLTEQYKSLGARFVLVYGFDRAQLYYLGRPADRLLLYNGENGEGWTRLEARYQIQATLPPHQTYDLPRALSYTLRVPLGSVDGDVIPDQLQELAPLWTRIVSAQTEPEPEAPRSLDTDSGHAALVYSWVLAAELLRANGSNPELASRLERSALRGSSFALSNVGELRNRNDFLPTYANGHDYGFHLAIFDWAYRQTCDVRYREAFLSLADDLARPEARGGLQIGDPRSPSYGGYLSTQQSRASGATRVGDQGIRLWALRIAYQRTGELKYRRSAELFLDHWLRLDPETHSFTGTVFVARRYRDAGVEQERSPLGHYAVLAALKAWSDVLPRARQLYAAGLSAATGRHLVHRMGLTGPHRLLLPRQGLADFSDDAELGGLFLWATTLEPSAFEGPFAPKCGRESHVLGAGPN
jgi:hypothetical protein